MKICPRCQRTYTDDNLNFCLDDGVVLQQASSAEPPATVFMNQPQPTVPQSAAPSQPTMQPAWNTAPQQYGGPPKKSSKAWIWVLLILGLVVILCGGGLIGFFAYLAAKGGENTNVIANSSNNKTFPGNKNAPSNTAKTTSSPDDRNDVQQVDLSVLVKAYSIYGDTEYDDGELTMSSKQKGFYYVVVATGGYKTNGANTRVTVQNRDNVATNIGYGLVFHSNPTPLTQDYAFLLDTTKKRYRLVRHQPGTETAVVAWTNSNAIKDGSQDNVLEIRDHAADGKCDLYINGQLVNTVSNRYGYEEGVPGLYAGDAVKVVFKDFEIRK